MLVLSARFDLATPSMVDDWGFATAAPRSLAEILEPFTSPTGSRFRPGWELWNELQWHTLGAPGDLTGPNLWAVLRVLLFVAGAVLVPSLVAATARERPSPVELAALGGATGLLLFSAPGTNLDFLRLGPTEPIMFGALSCGAGLLLAATGQLLARRAEAFEPAGTWARGSPVLVGGMFAAGLLLWLLGGYHKEATICVLVLAPFVYLFLDRRWRERGLLEGPLWRSRPFQVVGVVMLLPIMHIAMVAGTVSDRGVSLYGAEQPSGISGWLSRAVDSFSQQWGELSPLAGTSAWRIVAVALPLILVAVAVARRRVPWLALGLILTGWATLVFQGVPLLEQSRYYLPVMGCWAAAALLLIAETPRWSRWTAIAAAVALAAANIGDARDQIDGWRSIERDDAQLLQAVADLHPATCPVYMANVDLERSESLPRLLGSSGLETSGACTEGYAAILFGGRVGEPFALGTTRSITMACAEREQIEATLVWEVIGCRRLNPDVAGEPVADVLRQNHLVPGVGLGEVRERCAERLGPTRCGTGEQAPG